jgi:hypothetical protein
MAVFKSTFAGGKPKYGKKSGSARQPVTGVHLLDFSVEIPASAMQGTSGTDTTTATDAVLLYKFPDDSDAYILYGGLFQTATGQDKVATENLFRVDLDALDAGASLKWNMGFGDSDGVIDTNIIASSTVGQTAGKAYAKTAAALGGPDKVDGKYLIWRPTDSGTPATAAAGTVRVRALVAYGLKAEVDSSLV